MARLGTLLLFCLSSVLCGVTLLCGGCGPDNRLGLSVGQALVDGPIRIYASQQAVQVALSARSLSLATQEEMGMPRDRLAAREHWLAVRLAYDLGSAFFFVATPDLNQALDGRFDDRLATHGLRQLEPLLFSNTPPDAVRLDRLGQSLLQAGVALSNATPNPANAVTLSAFLGSLSAQAAVAATKLDGSDSPYAGVSHRSIESNLLGLQAMYLALAPAVQNADPDLHARIVGLLTALLSQVQGVAGVDGVVNKVAFLRSCGDLSAAFLAIGTALGLSVAAPVDVT